MTPTTSRHPSISTVSISSDVRRQSPAFRGASHAFSSASPVPKPLPNTYSGVNGALAAASTAGLGMRRQEQSANLAGSYGASPFIRTTHRSDTSEMPEFTPQAREQSPSQVAALLAAARSTPTLGPGPGPGPKRPNSHRPSPVQGIQGDYDPLILTSQTDESSIAATHCLVNLFESKQRPITHSVRPTTKPAPKFASPTPRRPPLYSSLSATGPQRPFPIAQEVRIKDTALDISYPVEIWAASPGVKSAGPGRPKLKSYRSHTDATSSPNRGSDSSPLHTFVFSGPPSRLALSSPSPGTSQKRGPVLEPITPGRSITRSSDSYMPQLTVDSLANAMVASSLASSRAPSPTKPAPPLGRRRGKSHSMFQHHISQEQIARTPSPAKVMRHTLREPPKSDDEVNYRNKSHLIRNHPHKHREGDRKRYRNEVTERERKRYEGVWAANKGLLTNAESPDAVLNIVVRDIWRRSRLPNDALEEIWDLVDRKGNGMHVFRVVIHL